MFSGWLFCLAGKTLMCHIRVSKFNTQLWLLMPTSCQFRSWKAAVIGSNNWALDTHPTAVVGIWVLIQHMGPFSLPLSHLLYLSNKWCYALVLYNTPLKVLILVIEVCQAQWQNTVSKHTEGWGWYLINVFVFINLALFFLLMVTVWTRENRTNTIIPILSLKGEIHKVAGNYPAVS